MGGKSGEKARIFGYCSRSGVKGGHPTRGSKRKIRGVNLFEQRWTRSVRKVLLKRPQNLRTLGEAVKRKVHGRRPHPEEYYHRAIECKSARQPNRRSLFAGCILKSQEKESVASWLKSTILGPMVSI